MHSRNISSGPYQPGPSAPPDR